MNVLSEQRCFNHNAREAVARCPECGRFFCRECITEHEGRVVCAGCLLDAAGGDEDRRLRFHILRPVLAAGSFVLMWAAFFMLGRTLLVLPDAFHDGSVWTTESLDSPDEDTE